MIKKELDKVSRLEETIEGKKNTSCLLLLNNMLTRFRHRRDSGAQRLAIAHIAKHEQARRRTILVVFHRGQTQ